LLPSLRHEDRRLRAQAIAILRMMVCRETECQPNLTLTQELLAPELVELLLTELATDSSADVRASSAEVIVYLADARVKSVMRKLIADGQWFVRLRAIRALSRLRHASASLPLDVRKCLYDPDCRVRETAIHTLIAFGHEGKRHLYEHFLAAADRTVRQQIVEAIEHTGLMSGLVEEYSAGIKGAGALMIEHLANDADILGLSGVLRTLSPDIRKKFLDRFLPYAEGKMRFLEETLSPDEPASVVEEATGFPPRMAA
jgi:HEAT repeat protein